MTGLVIAGMIVQLLALLALCLHHAQTVKLLREVRAALAAVSVIREEIGGLSGQLERMTAAPGDAIVDGFANLMTYSEQMMRGARE